MEEAKPFPHFGTDALHAGQEPEQWKSMAVIPPISMSTTFKQHGPAEHVVKVDFLLFTLGLKCSRNCHYSRLSYHVILELEPLLCSSVKGPVIDQK